VIFFPNSGGGEEVNTQDLNLDLEILDEARVLDRRLPEEPIFKLVWISLSNRH
jgi:hypothetical protein